MSKISTAIGQVAAIARRPKFKHIKEMKILPKTVYLSLFLALFLYSSCQEAALKREHSGFNIQGRPETCAPMVENKICTEIFTEEDRYAATCRSLGHEALQCDCHKFLCSEKIEF